MKCSGAGVGMQSSLWSSCPCVWIDFSSLIILLSTGLVCFSSKWSLLRFKIRSFIFLCSQLQRVSFFKSMSLLVIENNIHQVLSVPLFNQFSGTHDFMTLLLKLCFPLIP